jgi:UDP-N-acetylglucosamine--N-acetylmuramyl-(pentapeptide) pyrophosphoryl-undecaprenol N-acetylglucosamine transferase
VVGGSLGAKAINDVIPQLLGSVDFPIELWHQTGKSHFELVRATYDKNDVRVKLMPFIDNMAEAFAWADLVICRSGAMTVSELAVAGLPAIFIPFPFAIDDHQTANAKWMADAGAAILMPQNEMSIEKLKLIISELNADRMKLKQMKNKAAALGIHDATSRVANYCVELAQ